MPDHPSSRFEVVPTNSGLGWRVRMRRPSGLIQYINGFDTEADAASWISNEGADWFAKTENAAQHV